MRQNNMEMKGKMWHEDWDDEMKSEMKMVQ